MLNQCQFIGHLGADPEIRSTQGGSKIANIRIAVSEKWKQNGEQKERTEWISVAIFSEGLVGVVERFLRKGSKIFVSGKMQTRKWQDQSGNDRYTTEIVLSGPGSLLTMLDGPTGERSSGAPKQDRSQGYGGFGGASDDLDDECPFD